MAGGRTRRTAVVMGGDLESQGGRPEGTQFRTRLGVRTSPFGSVRLLRQPKIPLQTNLRPRHIADGRKHSRRDVLPMLLPENSRNGIVSSRIWDGPSQPPLVQKFLECHLNQNPQMLRRIPVSVVIRHSPKRMPETLCFSLLLLFRPGGEPPVPRGCRSAIASYQSVGAMHPPTATIRRLTARRGCSCSLLFAVIPPPYSQKSEDFRGVRQPLRCFFPAYQR